MAEYESSSTGRLDLFLSGQNGILSRAKAQKIIKDGHVQVNGKVITKVAFILKEGDKIFVVDIGESGKRDGGLEPTDLGLEILYEDEACMVINKPAGFAVHPASSMEKGEKTILHGIAFIFGELDIRFSPDAVLVHRLDKETTGCLLIAKTTQAHAALQKQFEERTVSKKYLALVAGAPQPANATIDAPIGRNLMQRTMMSIFKTSKSRDAKTTYRTIKANEDSALIECDLHTGRTHQVRVHLSSIGHPILGDPKYKSPLSVEVTEEYEIEGLCLHAWKLSFVTPDLNIKVSTEASLPPLLIKALERVGIDL
ncbi:MAG: RluA family pseudouridine synthase [Kiritimatiellales bacterium]|nr:RluA family pseudouridine synthase [Kiritimatiellales bacterium]